MRGDFIYHLFGVHQGRETDVHLGTFRTREEALAEIERLQARLLHGRNWAEQYHNKGFVIREAVVNTDFEVPPRPTPREKYFVVATAKANRPGTWDSTHVEVFRRGDAEVEAERVCQYDRNYSMLSTFEPFRQGDREFALISRCYTKTAVLDLSSGCVIAEEAETDPPGCGFCPVGFYVPDWWDVHGGHTIPGSPHWGPNNEWPVGTFGFVWGCVWGDDSSWKVQYLDLSRVRDGIIARDERFGYVELATQDYQNPCLTPNIDPSRRGSAPPFIHVSQYGVNRVSFAVDMAFDLDSGKPRE